MKSGLINHTHSKVQRPDPAGPSERRRARTYRLVLPAMLLAALLFSACGSPTPMDQGQDTSPLPAGTTAAIEEATAPPSEQSPLPTATAEPQAEVPTVAPETQEASTVPTKSPNPTPPDSSMRNMVQQATEDLARRLGLAEAEITVQSVEKVDWPDGSLGCPLPGAAYPQVVTPGYIVVLEADGGTFEYHTNAGRVVVLCEEDGLPSLPVIPVDPSGIKDGIPWMPIDPVPTRKP